MRVLLGELLCRPGKFSESQGPVPGVLLQLGGLHLQHLLSLGIEDLGLGQIGLVVLEVGGW